MTNSARAASRGVGRIRLATMGVLVLLWGLAWAAPGWPQVPDNRGVKLDPEDAISPAYEHTLEQRDRQRLDEAQARGESFISTFHGMGEAPDAHPPAVLPDVDEEWANTAAVQDPAPAPRRPLPVYESGRPEAVGAESGDGLAAMVEVLLESWTRPPQIARLRYGAAEPRAADAAVGAGAQGPLRAMGADGPKLPPIKAGDGFYARTLYAVDSDYPGPVVLELLQPPLAGAVAHGGFERVRQRLVLRLSSLTWKGWTFPVEAWAVDPECACYGIEGEVDRHFVSRVLLPAAARFAEGFLNAVAMPARTLTVENGTVLHERAEAGTEEALYAGAAAAAGTLGDILTGDAPKETTVRIPRNTPLVVMVARHVVAPPGESR